MEAAAAAPAPTPNKNLNSLQKLPERVNEKQKFFVL